MEKTIYTCDADEFPSMTLEEAIKWLQGIADQQPCPPDQVIFRVSQSGDQWDGYSLAEITVTRDETPEEEAQRQQRYAEAEAKRQAQYIEQERADYERLKAKFG